MDISPVVVGSLGLVVWIAVFAFGSPLLISYSSALGLARPVVVDGRPAIVVGSLVVGRPSLEMEDQRLELGDQLLDLRDQWLDL